jgi:hypothetical protein
MKKLAVSSLCLGCIFAAVTTHAIDLKQSKVTQVVNEVQIISAADQKEKAAAPNDIFSIPDILRTGAASRAELVAQDQTVTRVGANTIFSFDPANRTIDLQQGSLLFHSQHGKGGGTIHTGSATASVLGTTVIVVTTPGTTPNQPNGFKVLDLEGQVEVHLLNGLLQKLNPGQMTFVLPGANQLAPVVIFRLDELIRNSLLVKGFNQNLDSLSLIQNQVNKQLKLILSGKLTDTGYVAGNNATPNQVEVLDLNTVSGNQHQTPPPQQSPPPPPPPKPDLNLAESSDATVNQSSLTDVTIPSPPLHIFDQQFSFTGNGYLNGRSFEGFVARNIYFNTIESESVPVDLSPYTSFSTFAMVAVDALSLEGSVTFQGLPTTENLELIAGTEFDVTPGITVQADVNQFILSSPSDLTLDGVNVVNDLKDITINSGGAIYLQDNAQVNAAGKAILQAANDLSFANSQLSADSALLTSLNGTISLENSTLNASSHAILIAPISITMDNSTVNSPFVTLSGTAGGSISLNDTTINAASASSGSGERKASDAGSSSSAIVAVSGGDINITGTSIGEEAVSKSKAVQHDTDGGSALIADPNSGSITLSSTAGSVNVTGTSITTHYLSLNSGDGILLDSAGHTLTASGSGATANFTAPNLLAVNNTDFGSFATVNMAANTIDLLNVKFGGNSTVNLRSQNGVLAPNPNTGAAPVPGDVNFISGVTYGGNPAQNYIGSGIFIGRL